MSKKVRFFQKNRSYVLTNVYKQYIITKLKEEVIHFSPNPNKEKGYKMKILYYYKVIGVFCGLAFNKSILFFWRCFR